MSVFTEYMKKLTTYSEGIDAGTVTFNDFIDFQRMQPDIIQAYQRGYYLRNEYEALSRIYFHLEEGFKIVLRSDLI